MPQAKGARGKDWAALETEYVTGDSTLAQIAEKHGVSVESVEKRSAADKWGAKRADYRRQVADEIRERAKVARVEIGAARLAALADTTARLQEQLDGLSHDVDQLRRHLVPTASGEVIERIFAKGDTRGIAEMARAAKDLTAAIKSQYNIPNAKEQHDMDLADKRFELEQENRDKPKEVIVRMADGTDLKDYSV